MRVSITIIRTKTRLLELMMKKHCPAKLCPWSEEELKCLEENSHLSARVAQATLFPNRTRYAVQKARERLKKRGREKRKSLKKATSW